VFLSRGFTPPLAFLTGFKSFEQALAWDPSTPTKILLVPRGEGEVRVIEAEPFFQFHFGNAYETDGQVWVDVLRYPDFRVNAALRLPLDIADTPGAEAWRFRIDPQGRKAEGQRLAPDWVELAQYDQRRNTRSYRYLYGLSQIKDGGFDTRLVKFDLEAGKSEHHDFGPLNYPGEPIFVPARAGAEEDEGWIVTFVYSADEHLTKVAILDARDFASRPVATLTLRAHVPYGFHGNFTPRTFGAGRSV
jgi:all-trans-8'-apo-beta-carotenal 15,15'-oxygenase